MGGGGDALITGRAHCVSNLCALKRALRAARDHRDASQVQPYTSPGFSPINKLTRSIGLK